MTPTDRNADDVLAWLLERSRERSPVMLTALAAEAFERVGARLSCIYLADHDLRWLHPLGPDRAAHDSLRVDGTLAGRSYTLEAPLEAPEGDGVRQYLPLVDGTARLGTVVVILDRGAAARPATRRAVRRIVLLIGELVVTRSPYTDTFTMARRRRDMSLQAEMQRRGLPPEALTVEEAAVAGILLPAYEVAGDSYDYCLNEDGLYVAVVDSVGHALESSMVSYLVSSCLRNARRNGTGATQSYLQADEAVRRIFPDLQFATAAYGRLDLRDGHFGWVSAGHPPPLLVRGGKVVGEAPTVPALPIGLAGPFGDTREVVVNELDLEPGDALLFYTDGVTEGGARGAERFGLDRLVDLLGRGLLAGLSPAELVRRLAIAVMEHTAYELHDDTTLVLIEYRRSSVDGARSRRGGTR